VRAKFHSKLSLSVLPTPLERLPRLTNKLGVEVWIKRDDLTSSAGGGNKVRKLEFLLAEAVEAGSQTIITLGAVQSNHCRQTALLAAKLGLERHLVLIGEEPPHHQGNLLLDELSGAILHFVTDHHQAVEAVASLKESLEHNGKNVTLIPYGGSNALGVQGYVQAWQEMHEQAQARQLSFDSIVLSSSSGGTQAGLLLGQQLFAGHGSIIGISAGPTASQLKEGIKALIRQTAACLEASFVDVEPQVEDAYTGPGYALLDDRTIEAIRHMAQSEAILLDPVYTGKAFAGLLAMAREDRLGKCVLFWHTGGSPALYPYGDQLFATAIHE
jgi:L-cysteate sulfo-lyase